MFVGARRSLTLAWALACAVLSADCAPELTVTGDCDALVFDGAATFPRDDLDVLIVLDATGRTSFASQAELVVRILGVGVDGDRDGDGVPSPPDFEPLSDVHVAFITGGLGASCDETAATTLAACGEEPFVAYGKYGTPPRPSRAVVEGALRCAVSVPRSSCASNQPFEAAARALAAERSSPTGFRRPGAALAIISTGGPSACDGPTGTLPWDRTTWALIDEGFALRTVSRVCTDLDAAMVADAYVDYAGPEQIWGLCLPREVQRDELGAPACEIEETIAWPDPDACAALASNGRDPAPVSLDATGHATCRFSAIDTLLDGTPVGDAPGFYVDDWSAAAVSSCGAGGAMLRWSLGAELLPGSALHVHCVAAASMCR